MVQLSARLPGGLSFTPKLVQPDRIWQKNLQNWSFHTVSGPPGPSVAGIDGPPVPSMAATDGLLCHKWSTNIFHLEQLSFFAQLTLAYSHLPLHKVHVLHEVSIHIMYEENCDDEEKICHFVFTKAYKDIMMVASLYWCIAS